MSAFASPKGGQTRLLRRARRKRACPPSAALFSQFRGQYVAIHEGQVVDSGDGEVELALRVYRRFGNVPIDVGRVSGERPATLRAPSPRVLGKGGLMIGYRYNQQVEPVGTPSPLHRKLWACQTAARRLWTDGPVRGIIQVVGA